MVLRIEKILAADRDVLRLSGDLEAEQLNELKALIRDEHRTTLDLSELSLVDLEAVRFLGACEEKTVVLHRCPPYIREWINREKET
jgi:hypothetical protein